MSEADSLMRAAAADPDDDLPRLIYADWLEENGDPDRAEFVRANVRLAGTDGADPDVYDLRHREQQLWQRHKRRWTEALPRDVGGRWQRPRRGLFDSLVIDDWDGFTHHARELFADSPLARVAFRPGFAPTPRTLAAAAELRPLRELDLSYDTSDAADIAPNDRPALLAIELAGWEADTPDDLLTALTASPHLGDLRELVVPGSATPEPLLARPNMPNLRRFSGPMPAGLFNRWFAADAFGELRHLRLRTWAGEGQIDWRAVADSDAFLRLESLDMPFGGVVGEGFDGLARGRRAGSLRRLDLRQNPVGSAGLRNLAAAASLAGLSSLRLSGCHVEPDALGSLDGATFWPTLRRLDLDRNPLGGAALGLWSALPEGGPLLHLDLSQCGVPALTMLALARWPVVPRLRVLRLESNPLRDTGVARLAPALLDCHELDLENCGITGNGLTALLESPCLPNLRRLNLSRNVLTDRDLARLADAPLTSLRCLSAVGNSSGRAGVAALLRAADRLPHWHSLGVSRRGLEPDLIKELRDRFGQGLYLA